jgi:plastocyanin
VERPTDPFIGEVRFRVPLPILIPLGAIALIALVTIGFSRVLLSIPPEAATAVAVATAANVLIACAVVALRPRMSQTSLVEMGVVVLYPVVIGIVIAQLGLGEAEGTAEQPPPASAPAAGNSITASNSEFNTDTLELEGGGTTTIEFTNEDTFDHNVALYENQADGLAQENPVFQGELISGTSTTYEFDSPPPGDYYFQCDVHAQSMNGTATVK